MARPVCMRVPYCHNRIGAVHSKCDLTKMHGRITSLPQIDTYCFQNILAYKVVAGNSLLATKHQQSLLELGASQGHVADDPIGLLN